MKTTKEQRDILREFYGTHTYGADPSGLGKSVISMSDLIDSLETLEKQLAIAKKGLEYYKETRKIAPLQAVISSYKSSDHAEYCLSEIDRLDGKTTCKNESDNVSLGKEEG